MPVFDGVSPDFTDSASARTLMEQENQGRGRRSGAKGAEKYLLSQPRGGSAVVRWEEVSKSHVLKMSGSGCFLLGK